MLNKNIIAISGLKGSGKDESAKMLQFCLNAPLIFRNYWFYKHFNVFTEGKYRICRFADTMKQMLSILLSVDIERFENRDFKENWFVDFTTLTLYSRDEVDSNKILTDNKFAKLAKELDTNLTQQYYLSIRQILQFFGTEIMRQYFGDKLWILSTFNQDYPYLIISDLRFKVELNQVLVHKGTIIYIHRPECEAGSHASERELVDIYNHNQYHYLVNNDKDLKNLFNQIKNISKLCQ